MNFADFSNKNMSLLKDYETLSKTAGARVDYVQGGGGNTSVKLSDDIMAIKASGYKLSQVETDDGFALLNYQKIRKFFNENDPNTLEDIEKEGSEAVKASKVNFEGFKELRPSVEAGFHALLDTFVLHSHSVYSNLIACIAEADQVLNEIFADECCIVDYVNPGINLTFLIKNEIDKYKVKFNKDPNVIFMKNHGLIVSAQNLDDCLRIHDEVNQKIIDFFGISEQEISHFNNTKLEEIEPGIYKNNLDFIKTEIKNNNYGMDFYVKNSLYPDQMVFLNDNVDLSNDAPEVSNITNKCTIFKTGDVFYKTNIQEAQTIQDTICAVLFIYMAVKRKGYTIATMDEKGKDFIKNWESEKYRKTLIQK